MKVDLRHNGGCGGGGGETHNSRPKGGGGGFLVSEGGSHLVVGEKVGHLDERVEEVVAEFDTRCEGSVGLGVVVAHCLHLFAEGGVLLGASVRKGGQLVCKGLVLTCSDVVCVGL